jgi:hypothetical protein
MDMSGSPCLIGFSFKSSSLQFVDAAHPVEVITESSGHPAHETKRLPRELQSLGWKPNPATIVSVLAPSGSKAFEAE